jgi:hypothetical protein
MKETAAANCVRQIINSVKELWFVRPEGTGVLKPIIDRIFKFDDMVEVHRYLENSGQFGKTVVTP